MIPPPPRPTLFPYTTLFRSLDVVFRPEELPEPFGPELREGVPDRDRTAQPIDVRGPVRPYDARPAFRAPPILFQFRGRSEEHTSELQSRGHLVCRLLLEKKK